MYVCVIKVPYWLLNFIQHIFDIYVNIYEQVSILKILTVSLRKFMYDYFVVEHDLIKEQNIMVFV